MADMWTLSMEPIERLLFLYLDFCHTYKTSLYISVRNLSYAYPTTILKRVQGTARANTGSVSEVVDL